MANPNSKTSKCIIYDLDKTFICTVGWDEPRAACNFKTLSDLNVLSDPKLMDLRSRVYLLDADDTSGVKGAGEVCKFWGIERPHLQEYLDFAKDYFRLEVVWSAGKANYVEEIVSHIFRNRERPPIVYTNSDCQPYNVVEDGRQVYDSYGHPLKNLEKPIQKLIDSEPLAAQYMTLGNTYALDDNETTFERVNPHNALYIPEYEPHYDIPSLREDDTALVKLQQWLLQPQVMNAKDVRTLDKTTVFN